MRTIFFACCTACIVSCNSSGQKDPNKAMDDTARQDPSVPVYISTDKATADDIPTDFKYKGKFIEGWKWNDNMGKNLFFTSRIEPYDEKDSYGDETQSAHLYAYQLVKKEDGSFETAWQMEDGMKYCSFDITTAFIPGSVTVTDLDRNGYAETKVQYELACRSDVSPSYMFLVMHENRSRWNLQGHRWIASSPDMKFDVTTENANMEKRSKSGDELQDLMMSYGRYESEKKFMGAPAPFLDFAKKEWVKFAIEKIGE
jgi:hypothetical protein